MEFDTVVLADDFLELSDIPLSVSPEDYDELSDSSSVVEEVGRLHTQAYGEQQATFRYS